MDIDLIFKLAALGIIVTVLSILLGRSGREEQALMVTIACRPLYTANAWSSTVSIATSI